MEKFLRKRLEELVKEQAEAEKKKAKAASLIISLNEKLAQNAIVIDDYSEELAKLKGTVKKFEDTIAYYKNSIESAENTLEGHQKSIVWEKILKETSLLTAAASVILTSLIVVLIWS
ncbi:hypothetical protein CMO88_02945 [Candidatus Woesearchaeota archaeon]|nr:hypothetical protein [Candidatus Woesearchaeota archaeon]|tara:strand:+ start:12027 stop:12377 length:351 start_codon:yes stop_codon:yes gene_type:complete